MNDDDIVDHIYEAGAVPELWPNVLHLLGERAGGPGAVLLAPRNGKLHWSASAGSYDMLMGYIERGYGSADQRTARLLRHDHAGFVTDLDVFTPSEWEADPIRRDYFIPNGYGWGIATAIRLPDDELYIFHSERELERGPFDKSDADRLDPLRPHLARAALMLSKLAFERNRGALAGMEVVGVPAGILDDRGRLIAANSLLEQLIPSVFRPRQQRLSLVQPDADRLLGMAIGPLAAGQPAQFTQSIPVRRQAGQAPMIAHLLPARRSSRDLFGRAATFLIVTPLARNDPPAVSIIQALLDLTPAEARIARSLAAGQSLNEISAATGVGLGTIRGQAKSVLRKTGMHRQTDLVGLLSGIPGVSSGGDER